MSASSTLPGPAFQASRAALSAALSDTQLPVDTPSKEDENEPGEIQEIDMQAQAETIRTVFSDPTNFNVKVNLSLSVCLSSANVLSPSPASSVLSLDIVV
jgi:hypothetical protein